MNHHFGPLIGMIHVGALPGTPQGGAPVRSIAQRAAEDARLLVDAGFDAVIIENMHDVPYLRREVGPEIVAGMTAAALAVRAAVDVPIGIQILAGANRAAMAVAHAADLAFIRAEGFAFASVADEGLLDEADAGPLLRYRRAVGATHIAVLADVRKKHGSHAITGDLDLAAIARGTEFFGADGVIVTGVATGEPTSIEEIRTVRAAVDVPVVVGSGATDETAAALLEHADAIIVGSWIKEDGAWFRPIDPSRAKRFVDAARG